MDAIIAVMSGKKLLAGAVVVMLGLGAAGFGAYRLLAPKPVSPFVRFDLEIYDAIQKNYWDKISDSDLSDLFQLGAEKLLDHPVTLATSTRAGVASLISDSTTSMTDAQKKDFVTQLGNLVLVNLKPFGRSALYTENQTVALRQTVANVDTSKNLYATVGAAATSTTAEIKTAAERQIALLSKNNSPAAAQKIAAVKYAEQVLANAADKSRYDQGGVEPTVFTREISPRIFYLRISKFAPTTLDEFVQAVQKENGATAQNSLILDLRGNIGGAVDYLPYLFGLFMGPNQYIYDLYQHGDYVPIRTEIGKLPELAKYQKNVVLIDNGTQSTAEDTAAVLKRFNLAVAVGTTTRGWGTIENTYPIDAPIDPSQKYSALIVNSVTLRDDGLPIEGRGIDPTFPISDKNWPVKFDNYFNYPELTAATEKIIAAPPLR